MLILITLNRNYMHVNHLLNSKHLKKQEADEKKDVENVKLKAFYLDCKKRTMELLPGLQEETGVALMDISDELFEMSLHGFEKCYRHNVG
jgi:hypothetical protein